MSQSQSPKRTFRASLLIAVSTLALAGCNRLDDYTAAELGNPVKRHPIAFSSQAETLYVEMAPVGAELSANQHADIWRFVDRYRKESTGTLRISAPGSASGHLATTRAVHNVQEIVQEAGVDPDAISIVRHKPSPHVGHAVRLSYDRPIANPPQCADWSTDLGENRERLPYNDFGCATQRNLALTVANGRDLQGPQQESPRSSERRSLAWSSYTGASGAGGSGSGGVSTGSGMTPSPAAPAP